MCDESESGLAKMLVVCAGSGLNTSGRGFFFPCVCLYEGGAEPLPVGMPAKTAPTISRELARIIRDSSLVEPTDAPLSRHLQAVEDRRAQGFEFYIRACALRLAEGGGGQDVGTKEANAPGWT